MNSSIFTTISGLPSIPPEGLVGTDKVEVEREGLSFHADLLAFGAYITTLIDLNAILQYVLDNIDTDPDLAAILQYIIANLDVTDLQNFIELTASDNVVIEYNPITKRFIASPLALNQELSNTVATINWDRTLGHNAEILLTQDTELILDNFIPGTYQLTITQDVIGGRTLDLVSNTHSILWSNGVWPTLSSAPNATDTYTFIVPPSGSDIRGVPQFNFS